VATYNANEKYFNGNGYANGQQQQLSFNFYSIILSREEKIKLIAQGKKLCSGPCGLIKEVKHFYQKGTKKRILTLGMFYAECKTCFNKRVRYKQEIQSEKVV
jgi:hypothetical protein